MPLYGIENLGQHLFRLCLLSDGTNDYMNKSWLTIKEDFWYPFQGYVYLNAHAHDMLDTCTFQSITTFLWRQWVKQIYRQVIFIDLITLWPWKIYFYFYFYRNTKRPAEGSYRHNVPGVLLRCRVQMWCRYKNTKRVHLWLYQCCKRTKGRPDIPEEILP